MSGPDFFGCLATLILETQDSLKTLEEMRERDQPQVLFRRMQLKKRLLMLEYFRGHLDATAPKPSPVAPEESR